MLKLALGLTNHEGNILRLAEQFEMRLEQCLQAIEGREVLAVLLETAEPVFAPGVFGQPGVGRGDQQQAARGQALVNAGQELAGLCRRSIRLAARIRSYPVKFGFRLQASPCQKLTRLAVSARPSSASVRSR